MLKQFATIILGGAVAFASIDAFSADKRLFREDFNGKRGSALDSKKWGTESHEQGRGQFTSRGWINGNGQIAMSVHTYNPKKPGTFAQSIIKTEKTFGPTSTKNIRIRWRAKVNHNQKGIVHGAFLYRQYISNDALKSDELDFEWLTNHTAGTSKDDLLVSTWNKWDRAAQEYEQDDTVYGTHFSREANFNKDTNAWRTYEMLWSRNSVTFSVDGKKVYSFNNSRNIPKGKMPVFINSWVPDSSWAEAYNGSFKPTRQKSKNKTSSMLVDWVDVYEVDK